MAREGGRDGDLQPPLAGQRRGTGKALQRIQPLAHMGQVGMAFGGEREVRAAEKPHAQHLFELADAVADGAGRDAQLKIGRASCRERVYSGV